jgi:hypothetical protein
MAATAGVLADAPPDHDAASYWASSAADGGADDVVAHTLWLRRTASAYAGPAGALRHLADAAARARAVVENVPDRSVLFQEKVMAMGDFVATWVTGMGRIQWPLDRPAGPYPLAL